MSLSSVAERLPIAVDLAPRRRIRLAHVQLLPLLSGVQRVTLDLLTSLNADEFERHLICREPGPLSEAAHAAGIACHFVPQMVRSISPARDWSAYRALRTLFRREQFDIVHTNSSKPGIVGRRAAAAEHVPVVIHTVHGFAFPAARSWISRGMYRAAERFCRAATDGLICLNHNDQAIARSQLGFSERQLHLIANGVDTTRLCPPSAGERQAARQALGCREGRPAIGMVGRLWPQKDPLCFVAMAKEVLRRGIDADFFLVGDGELRQAAEAMIAQLGIADRVRLLGWRDDIPRVLHALDLFVLTSRWEGLPLVILEALACGVPVVASNIPGNRDAVEDGHSGLLAEPGHAEAFAHAVARLLTDDALRQGYGAQARAAAQQRFSLQQMVSKTRALYLDLLDQAPAGRQSATHIRG